jgi:spore germination protein
MVKMLIYLLLMSAVLTGCWDRLELEERGFVIGIAIDTPAKGNEGEEQSAFEETFQFVLVGAMKGEQSSKGSGGNSKAYLNLSETGDTMFEIGRMIASQTSRSPFYEHMKNIIISESIARSDEFANVLDFFIRDHEMRKGIHIMVSKGPAKPLLDIVPHGEKLPVQHIVSVSENDYKYGGMLPVTRISDLHQSILEDESFVVQHIMMEGEQVKVAGAAVFRGQENKLSGFLDEEQTQGLNFITGEAQGGLLKTEIDDKPVIFEISRAKQKIKADSSDKNKLKFRIEIQAEGFIGDTFLQKDFTQPQAFSRFQLKIAEEIESLAKDTVDALQNDYKVDVMGINQYLKNNEWELWSEIKQDWERGENYFSKAEIEVSAKVNVRSSGTINKSNEKGG